MTKHPLDEWIESLDVVEVGDLRVLYSGRSHWPDLDWDSPCGFTLREIQLARSVFWMESSDSAHAIRNCLWKWGYDEDEEVPEEDEEASERVEPWRRELGEVLEGSETSRTPSSLLFRVSYLIGLDGMMGGSGGWWGETFNNQHVLIADETCEDVFGTLAFPLGLVPRDRVVEGAALLLRTQTARGEINFEDMWTDRKGGLCFDELGTHRLLPAETLKLLPALSGDLDDELLLMPAESMEERLTPTDQVRLQTVETWLDKEHFWLGAPPSL